MRKQPKSATRSRATIPLALATMAIAAGFALPVSLHAGESDFSQSGLPGVAAREISRRLENAKQAEIIAAEGDRLAADGDYAGAIEKYREALVLLPVAPATEAQRLSTIQRFSSACIIEARRLADEGDRAKAAELLQEVLRADRDPENRKAKTLLAQLDDPDRYPPARTPGHTEKAREVVRLLQMGESYYLLADYDKAEQELFKVLTIDPYNTASREMLEKIERTRMDYYGAAYNHTRARMLRLVDAAWETKPQLQALPSELQDPGNTNAGPDLRAENYGALQSIIIPKIDFEEITLAEAIDFLRSRSKEFDRRPDRTPENRGVNILIRSPQTVADQGQNYGEKTIPELSLTNVPLGEALRYLCEMVGMRVKVEQFAVVLVPISVTDADLYSRSFRVPPDFIPSEGEEGGGAPAAEFDPFAAAGAAGGGAWPRQEAQCQGIPRKPRGAVPGRRLRQLRRPHVHADRPQYAAVHGTGRADCG